MEYQKSSCLVVIDYNSRYIELLHLSRTTSASVIDHLRSFFASHGVPDPVVSDNGPQYKLQNSKRLQMIMDLSILPQAQHMHKEMVKLNEQFKQ